jgi:hypothetical protein
VVIQILMCVILYQNLCGNSNCSVRGSLEVVRVVDDGPCVIIYQRLRSNSNRAVRGTLVEAELYLKSVREMYFSRVCVEIQIVP